MTALQKFIITEAEKFDESAGRFERSATHEVANALAMYAGQGFRAAVRLARAGRLLRAAHYLHASTTQLGRAHMAERLGVRRLEDVPR